MTAEKKKQTNKHPSAEILYFRLIPPRIVSVALWFLVFTTLVMQIGFTLLFFIFLPKYLDTSFIEMQKDFPQLLQAYLISWLAFLPIPYSVWSTLRLKRESRLSLSEKEFCYYRKGIPLLGWFARDRCVKLNNLERLIIIVRRYPLTILLRADSSSKSIEVNLTETINEGEKQSQILPRDKLRSHPLVKALEARSGLKSIIH